MSHQDDLRRFLEMVSEMKGLDEGYYYRNIADFLLQEGRFYEPRPLRPDVRLGAPKQCFGNAIMLAGLRDGWTYVEGYAIGVIPVHHAWNLDASRQLVDNTWLKGLAYCGVEFSIERADNCTWDGDASILDDWHRGWPIFRQKWPGEIAANAVPASQRIRLLRAGKLKKLRRVLAREVIR